MHNMVDIHVLSMHGPMHLFFNIASMTSLLSWHMVELAVRTPHNEVVWDQCNGFINFTMLLNLFMCHGYKFPGC